MNLLFSYREDPHITNVTVVHCETSSGILNPVQELGELIKDISTSEWQHISVVKMKRPQQSHGVLFHCF